MLSLRVTHLQIQLSHKIIIALFSFLFEAESVYHTLLASLQPISNLRVSYNRKRLGMEPLQTQIWVLAMAALYVESSQEYGPDFIQSVVLMRMQHNGQTLKECH